MGETRRRAKSFDGSDGYIRRKRASRPLDEALWRHFPSAGGRICADGRLRYIRRMKPFVAIVHREPNSAYGVTFPDAPGCFAAADEMDDLFANAADALALWADGLREDGIAAPQARDLSEIKADPLWAEAFADAALVIAVPAPQPPVRRAA